MNGIGIERFWFKTHLSHHSQRVLRTSMQLKIGKFVMGGWMRRDPDKIENIWCSTVFSITSINNHAPWSIWIKCSWKLDRGKDYIYGRYAPAWRCVRKKLWYFRGKQVSYWKCIYCIISEPKEWSCDRINSSESSSVQSPQRRYTGVCWTSNNYGS